MAKTKTNGRRRAPKMGRHSSGQARVTLNGKVHYLGPWGSPESYAEYAALVKAWEQGDRQPLHKTVTVAEARFTLHDLFGRYREYLDQSGRYVKAGKPTSQRSLIDRALDELAERFGHVPVHRFGETMLLQHRDELERTTLTRAGINRKVNLIRQAFGWGRRRGLVPKAVWLDLKAVEPLSRVECGNRPEGRPKRIPTLDEIRAILPHCSPQVGAMLKLQVLTGMRPGEVCKLRWADIDRSPVEVDGVACWTYVVADGKTSHHGHRTVYPLNGACQEILAAFPRPAGAFVFSPRDAVAESSRERRARRETPPTRQMRERDAAPPQRTYATGYSTTVYRHAIQRACRLAGVSVASTTLVHRRQLLLCTAGAT